MGQRLLRVGDLEAGQPGRREAALGQRRDRAARLRPGEEVVRIEALALQRDEQVARLQRAGVAVDPLDRERRIADEASRRQQRVGLGQGHHHAAPRSRNAAPASSMSEYAMRTPPMSW